MRLFKAMGLTLLFFFYCISSVASADVVVFSEGTHYDFYLQSGTSYKASYSKGVSGSISVVVSGNKHSKQKSDSKVIVVDKLITYWIKPPYGTGKIRITVPLKMYMASWDVRALEKELERLGVKVKSKPVVKPVPKPRPVISG